MAWRVKVEAGRVAWPESPWPSVGGLRERRHGLMGKDAGSDCPELPPVTEWVTHRTGADPQRVGVERPKTGADRRVSVQVGAGKSPPEHEVTGSNPVGRMKKATKQEAPSDLPGGAFFMRPMAWFGAEVRAERPGLVSKSFPVFRETSEDARSAPQLNPVGRTFRKSSPDRHLRCRLVLVCGGHSGSCNRPA